MIDGVTTTVKVAHVRLCHVRLCHVRLCHVRLCHVRLCHGRMTFVRAHPRESQERGFDAHDRAFALFGGACTKGIHDSGHCPPLVRGQWARRPRWTRSSWAASAPTTAAFSRRAATTGSNPSPARRPRAGRRGRSRDLRGHGPAALLRAAGEGEEPRGTRRLAGGPLHGPGQGASPSASARRRRSGRRRSRGEATICDRATEPRGASRALRARGASPLVAHLRCASRQRREPSCGAPAVRFAPEARALLWRTCGALRARGASPLVAHLRCASRQRREPSCGAPAVRRLACRAGRGVEDLPRALRQQHVLGLCLRGRASRRGPRLRRPRRGPPGRPGHRPSIGVPSGAAGRSTTPGDCGARARSQAGRARGAARPSRAGSCRTRSSASAASFAAWPMATGRWSRSSAPCGATGFPPSRRPAPRPSACGVHSADAILNILARRCAGRAPAVRPRAVAARHDHDPRGGSRLAHDPRGGSRLAHDPRGGSRLAHDPRGGSRLAHEPSADCARVTTARGGPPDDGAHRDPEHHGRAEARRAEGARKLVAPKARGSSSRRRRASRATVMAEGARPARRS